MSLQGPGPDRAALPPAEQLAELRASAEQYRGLVESAPDAMVVVDRSGAIVLVNRQTELLLGYARAELIGRPVELLVPERLRTAHVEHRNGFLASPGVRAMGSGIDLSARRKDGSEVPVEISLSPLETSQGRLVSASIRDISERRAAQSALKAAHDELELRVRERTAELERANAGLEAEVAERRQVEAALRSNDAKLRLITDNMPAGMAYIDAREIHLYHNQRFADWLERPTDKIDGHSVAEVMGEATYQEIAGYLADALAGQPVRYDQDHRSSDGSVQRWSVRYSPQFDATGQVTGVMAMYTDVTEQRHTEQVLYQAQKMEAVGQLTGGVAHDFNNLLTVVLGNLQILANRHREDELSSELIQAAINAARRGAELNRTLLAFSRRQRLAPAAIQVDELIAGMASMLRRTLGETIQITVVATADLPRALADPAQLEAALLNLAVNARDAMPHGGKLTIETASAILDQHYAAREADVTPGRYVMLAVSDTGCGMTPEVQRRAFEPFFTTKEVGKGSGLGLAMVYGFVKQSGGHLKIYSEVGHGTTVRLYLPLSKEAQAAAAAPAAPSPQPTGVETILIVEDEDDVRTLVCRLLGALGYRVLAASDGAKALEVLAREDKIDLLFTDVVLPGGINGPQLAQRVQQRNAAVKVLYTSGYTGNAIQQLEALAGEVRLISKPYRIEELAHQVRCALDGTTA